MATSKTNRFYKCPFCNSKFKRVDLVSHIADNHEEELPEDFSPFRYTFHYINNKPLTYHGICTECKGKTPWDENAGRYKRQCGKKACHDSFVRKFEENMVKTRGVTRISSTASGQVDMLKHRKISGEYTFQNGDKKGYVGTYERSALEFLDKVLNIDPNDLMSPGPILEYKFEGKTHIYITDFYYQPYNLIIEVKDGGDNPNNRNMPEYRAKQIEKEQYIIKHTNYNYIRLTDNKLDQLMNVFVSLRMEMNENTGERVIHVNEGAFNEAMNALMTGKVIGLRDNPNCTYITNYMMKPTFVDEKEYDNILLSKHLKFDEGFVVNSEGVLEYVYLSEEEINKINTVYKIEDVNSARIYKELAHNLGKKVDENFIYETVFKKKMYTKDQIFAESNVHQVISFNDQLKMIETATANYILGEEKSLENSIEINETSRLKIYKDITLEDTYLYKDKVSNLIVTAESKDNDLMNSFFDDIIITEEN